MHGDTREVRSGDALDWPALVTWLHWHLADGQLPGLRFDAGLEVSQFHGGHANLTYLLRLGGAELVLRRPPMAATDDRAHDVAREYDWLAALHPVFPLAPRPLLLCEDRSVLGTVFYLMERRRGLVVRDEEPLQLAGHEPLRRRVGEALVDALADLHAIDITDEPLAALGQPIGFLDRQVRMWSSRWAKLHHAPAPAMDAVALWLTAHQPPDALDPAVVHGAFALENLLLDPLDLSRVVAVLDWELAQLGDPLVDLGVLLAHWDPTPAADGTNAFPIVTGRPGYLTRDALVERYAIRAGRDLTDIDFYEVLALFTRAVWEQEHAAPSATVCDRVTALAARALQLTQLP